MEEKLKHDLIKIVIDKLLIAFILILFGFIGNLFLEKQKSINSLSSHANQIRLEKISEIWEAVYLLYKYEDKFKKVSVIYNDKYEKYKKNNMKIRLINMLDELLRLEVEVKKNMESLNKRHLRENELVWVFNIESDLRETLKRIKDKKEKIKYRMKNLGETSNIDFKIDLFSIKKEYTESIGKLREVALSNIENVLEKNRFWISDKEYKKIKLYIEKSIEFYLLQGNLKNESSLHAKEKKLLDLRGNIEVMKYYFISNN